MVSQAKGGPTGKKPRKIFGLMSKRRWFGVCVFLVVLLWSYTIGPDLQYAYISNRYFRNPRLFDYSTVFKEGDTAIFTELFEPNYFKESFVWQSASNFEEPMSPVVRDTHILFTDPAKGMLFSFSDYKGTSIEEENLGDLTPELRESFDLPGPSGIALDPRDSNTLYVAQSGKRRIIRFDLTTKEKTVIVDSYDGKPFNAPRDLVVDKEGKYLYFSDPTIHVTNAESCSLPPSLYRVTLASNAVELISDALQQPYGLEISTNEKELFVTECIEGEFALKVFDISSSSVRATPLREFNTESLQWTVREETSTQTQQSAVKGAHGCTGGVVQHPKGYLFVTCPGLKVCIIDPNTGVMQAAIKMMDGARPIDVTIAQDRLWITGNVTLWEVHFKH